MKPVEQVVDLIGFCYCQVDRDAGDASVIRVVESVELGFDDIPALPCSVGLGAEISEVSYRFGFLSATRCRGGCNREGKSDEDY